MTYHRWETVRAVSGAAGTASGFVSAASRSLGLLGAILALLARPAPAGRPAAASPSPRSPTLFCSTTRTRINDAHADTELALLGQEIFKLANPLGSLETPEYLAAFAKTQRLSRDEGLDAVMTEYTLDALIASTAPPPWPIDYETGDPPWSFFPLVSVAARAGYPVITVPAGFADDLPIGVCFVGGAFSEPTLIRLSYAFEQLTHARRAPPAPTQ